MKNILAKTAILLGLATLVLVPVAMRFGTGRVDPFYTRFTTDEAPSLIIGTSRAAQGLLPQEFELLAPNMQNFAFTIGHSPYGPAYKELISKKVEASTNDGIFLVAVDPWAVSLIYPEEQEADVESFRENGRFTSEINMVNVNPNYEYILRFYSEPLYKAFRTGGQPLKLHRNGWLEVDIPLDSAKFQAKVEDKLGEYIKHSSNGKISPTRLKSLEEILSLLDKHGQVFLVRLPVAREMAEIENAYLPDFDDMIELIAANHRVHYLNYFNTSGEYLTTDGNHLYKEAGKDFSQKVASDIKRIRQMASAN